MLENKCRTCGRDLDSGFNCPVCSNKTMTTPTKEQLMEIYNSAPLRGDIPAGVIKIIIDEWEKIRNSPK